MKDDKDCVMCEGTGYVVRHDDHGVERHTPCSISPGQKVIREEDAVDAAARARQSVSDLVSENIRLNRRVNYLDWEMSRLTAAYDWRGDEILALRKELDELRGEA